jgi:DNA-binding SARP family transcriptional activator/TolB-like protein
MPTLCVSLLGGCDCRTASGAIIVFPTRKVRALFAYLATVPGQVQSRERLAGLLWGGQSDQQARTNLRSSLSRLRRALPADVLGAEAGGITLASEALMVDVALFRQQTTAATPESLEKAVGLYKGAFLDGMEHCDEGFDDWLLAHRRQLEEAFQQALQQLLDHYVVIGAIDSGIQTALRLVHLDPLQESLHRNLIRLYLYQDRLGAALDQYRRCREVLWQELSVEPAPETEHLRAEILKQLPESALDEGAAPEVELDTVPERPHVIESAAAFRARQRGSATGLPSIAVLGFHGDAEEEPPRHLSDGLAEEIAIELGRFRVIEVIAPASAFTYRAAQVSPEQAGRELGAKFVLSGSLRARPDHLRIRVRLLDAGSAEQVWAERYDCPPSEFFEAQDELVRRIVSSLVGRIEAESLKSAKRKRPTEWAAYDLWLRGWDRLKQPDLKAIREARQLFNQAMVADPHFARPYVGQALAHLNEWACYSWNHWFFLKKDALDMARKAVQLDDHDNRAHGMLGVAEIYAGDYGKAKKCFTRALELNPNDCDVLAIAACALALIGDHGTAVEAGRRALRLAPHHPEWYVVMVGFALFAGRHYEEAIETMSIAPEANCSIPAVLAAAYAHKGEPERGVNYKDTVLRHFRHMVARGAYPSNRSCVEWLLDLDPFQYPADANHYEEGLRKAGFE